jgi:hypothetical protein
MSQNPPLKTENYIITYFNRYGARLKFLQHFSSSLTDAQAIANETLAGVGLTAADKDHYEPVSFAIDRRIFNSLDKGD